MWTEPGGQAPPVRRLPLRLREGTQAAPRPAASQPAPELQAVHLSACFSPLRPARARGEEDPILGAGGALSYWPESSALTVLYPRKPPVLGKTRRLVPPPCEEGSTEVWWR